MPTWVGPHQKYLHTEEYEEQLAIEENFGVWLGKSAILTHYKWEANMYNIEKRDLKLSSSF